MLIVNKIVSECAEMVIEMRKVAVEQRVNGKWQSKKQKRVKWTIHKASTTIIAKLTSKTLHI